MRILKIGFGFDYGIQSANRLLLYFLLFLWLSCSQPVWTILCDMTHVDPTAREPTFVPSQIILVGIRELGSCRLGTRRGRHILSRGRALST